MNKLHREPSIHITSTNLKLILGKVGVKLNDTQVIDILIHARKYQLSNRKLLAKNEGQIKKTNNIVKSSMENSTLMAKVIYYTRKRMKHRGIELLTPGHKDFSLVKSITKNALEYHEVFNSTERVEDAFNTYIKLGVKPDEKFSLMKLQYAHVKIMEYADATLEVTLDDNTVLTNIAYRLYTQMVIKQVGSLLTDYKNDPTKFKYFVQVAKECKRLKIRPEDYIKAQFDGLAWTNGIPEPYQLVGDKAQERLQKYLYQNQIQLGSVKENNQKNINKLKGLRKLK